jgi:hypothetical protein
MEISAVQLLAKACIPSSMYDVCVNMPIVYLELKIQALLYKLILREHILIHSLPLILLGFSWP